MPTRRTFDLITTATADNSGHRDNVTNFHTLEVSLWKAEDRHMVRIEETGKTISILGRANFDTANGFSATVEVFGTDRQSALDGALKLAAQRELSADLLKTALADFDIHAEPEAEVPTMMIDEQIEAWRVERAEA